MSILGYLKIARVVKKQKARVDSVIFRFHYRFTYVILMICCLLSTAKEFFGSPISCISKSKSVKPFLNTYCYIMSTFSVPLPKNASMGSNYAYPGTGVLPNEDVDEGYIRVHSYFMWVPVVLFFQGASFYMCHFIWKKLDGGSYETIAAGMSHFSLNREEREKKRKNALEYMMKFEGTHDLWCYQFFLCEIFNLAIVVGNLYFTDYFLGGTFMSYGTDVINFPEMSPEGRIDPMSRIFPKMAKCTFRKFGSSGTVEVHDAFCLLATNIINEKIYIFLWFWMMFLVIASTIWVLYRVVIMVSPAVRNKMLERKGKLAGAGPIKVITDRVRLGDWFLIYQLGFHMEPTVYCDFLRDLASEFQNSAPTLERKPMLMSN